MEYEFSHEKAKPSQSLFLSKFGTGYRTGVFGYGNRAIPSDRPHLITVKWWFGTTI